LPKATFLFFRNLQTICKQLHRLIFLQVFSGNKELSSRKIIKLFIIKLFDC